MAKVKVVCRIGEFDDEHLEALKAVVREAGGTFLRLKVIPDSEHWLEYHCRFRRKIKGLKRFARQVVEINRCLVEGRIKENEMRAQNGRELLPEMELLPTAWPNEERRAWAGVMLEQFLDDNGSIRHDLETPIGSYERDVAYDKVKEFLDRLKRELGKSFEDTEE